MINFWECFQGLFFMGIFGGLTRMALKDRPKPSSAPQTAQQAVRLPSPRTAPREEHGSLPVG